MRNIIIAILLLTAFTAQSQTKWRQIERSLTKWNVPAAYDSIPGQTGYAGKWIQLTALFDSLGIDSLGGGVGIAGSGAASKVAYWKSSDSLSFNNNFHWDNSNVRLGIGLTSPNYTIHSNGAIGTNNDFFLINPTYSNSGFRIQNYPGNIGGYGVGVIKGTNSSIWANANDGLLIRNDIKRMVAQSDFLVTENFGTGKAWLGSSDIAGATDVVIVDASPGSAEVTAMKYASNGYPPLHLRGHEINLHTNVTPNWPTFSTVNSADIAVTIKGDKKVGLSTTNPTRTLDVNGELRIRDLTTDNPTQLLGVDGDGDVSGITLGSGLSYTGTTLNVPSFTDSTIVSSGYGVLVTESPANTFTIKADTSKLVTQFDLLQVDQSATNEIQSLSTNGSAGNISISAGNTITLNVNDADASPTNEIQTLSHVSTSNSHVVSLSNSGGSLTLIEGTGINLTTSSNNVTINATTVPIIDSTNVTQGYGIIVSESPANTFTVTSDTSKIATLYDVSIVDQSATNELQTISTSGAAGNITLSNGGGTLNLNVNDADSSPTNEIQNITTNGTAGNITISSGSTLTLNVNDADASITNEIQTIDTFQVFDTNKLRISLSSDGEPAKVVTLPTSGGGTGIDSTIVTAGWGIDVTESPLNTFTVKADTAEVATQYDLTLKQDKLFSGTNIKTINSNSLLGSGNVSVGTVTSIATSAPITGGIITGSGTISLNYDNTYMGLDAFNRLYPLYNVATWNANQLRGTSIAAPFTPTTGQVLTYNGSAWSPSTPVASATNLTFTGSASPYTLNSDTGTDVTFAEGTGITLTRSSNQITIASTLTAPQTWGDFTTNIQSWGSTGTFGSGKDVGIGGQPTRDFDVIGDSRLRGAIYNSTNSAGTSGQVLTSNGSSAWSWATPADGSATNELQTISTSGGAGNITLSNGGGTLNLNVNDADASATNELQTLSHSADLISHTMTLSNSGGSLILAEGSGIALTTSGNQVTIASSVPFGSGELALSSDLNLTGITTTPIKVDFGATDAIINNYGTTQVMITYSGSFDPDATGNLKFAIYKNGTNLGYKSELNVWTQGTNDGMAFSKRFKTSSVLNDSFELYVIDTGDNFNSINLKNVVFIVELVY